MRGRRDGDDTVPDLERLGLPGPLELVQVDVSVVRERLGDTVDEFGLDSLGLRISAGHGDEAESPQEKFFHVGHH